MMLKINRQETDSASLHYVARSAITYIGAIIQRTLRAPVEKIMAPCVEIYLRQGDARRGDPELHVQRLRRAFHQHCRNPQNGPQELRQAAANPLLEGVDR